MSTKWWYDLTKRTLDIFLSVTALLILSPLLLVIALAIKLDSPGPVLHQSERVGKDGKVFNRLKFRTMLPSADHLFHPRLQLGWELVDDPRVTRIGRLLRRTYLDELLQYWNVLVGDMSLVGPRAERPNVVDELKFIIPDYDLRHSVKPGFTGLAQVNLLLGSSPFVEPGLAFEYDRRYVQHRSILLDLKILARTLLIWPGLDAKIPRRPISVAGRAPFDSEWARALESILQKDRQRFSEGARDIVEYLGKNIDLELTPWHESSQGMEAFSFDTSIVFRDTKLPKVLPVVLLFGRSLRKADLPDLHRLLLGSTSNGQHVGLLVFFGDHLSLSTAVGLLETSMKRAYACDVVVMSLEELQSLVLRRDPQKELRRLILSQVDLLSISPFIVTGPTPDMMFFGREQELREIAEHAAIASYAVIGGRRVGKSSLLGRLHRARLPSAGFRTLYHDCSTTPVYDAFLATTIRDWRPEPPVDTPATFGDLLQCPPDDKPLVLLLDEADKLVSTERPNSWPLFNVLRALANSGRAQVVLSGERTLRNALKDSTGPLFNFANELLIGRLEFRAVEELVTRPMKQLEIELVDEAAIVRRIYDFTSGHPNVVQRLCRRLIERLNERSTRVITLKDVNAVIEDPQFQEIDFLQTYWEAATPLEKVITLVLSQEARTYRLKEVRLLLSKQVYIQPSAAVTKEALDRLVDLRSILKRSQGGYAFAVEAFPRVLANTTTVEDLLEVLVEQYEQTEAQV